MRANGSVQLSFRRDDARVAVTLLHRVGLPAAREIAIRGERLEAEGRAVHPHLGPWLRDLARFTLKLNKAALRGHGELIAPSTILRLEARHAYQWFMLYHFPPAPIEQLPTQTQHAVLAVTRELQRALARPHGRPKLSRSAAEKRIAGINDPVLAPDERFARRLMSRLRAEDRLAATAARQLPDWLVELLAPKVHLFDPPA